MPRRRLLTLLAATLIGLLAMHGLGAAPDASWAVGRIHQSAAAPSSAVHAEASSDAAHGTLPATAPGKGVPQRDSHGGLHVFAVCALAVVAAVAIAFRHVLLVAGRRVVRVLGALVDGVVVAPAVVPQPPPAWVRLCVIRR